jgi:hypothetical protein
MALSDDAGRSVWEPVAALAPGLISAPARGLPGVAALVFDKRHQFWLPCTNVAVMKGIYRHVDFPRVEQGSWDGT